MNWKSNYGVSDEGASAAGVFGTPNSTWDIARAQQATQDLDAARSQAAYPVGGATPSYTPTYSTPIFSSSASACYYGPLPAATPIGKAFEWVGGMIAKIILASILIPVALLTVTLLVLGLTGFFTLPDTAGIDASAVRNLPISSSDYVSTNAMVQELADTPASILYTTHLQGAPTSWPRLNGRQRAAVEAAWLRYLHNPAGFQQLQRREYFMDAFNSYLLHRGHATSNPAPLLDRGRLVSGKPRLAQVRWSEGAIVLPRDPSLAAVALDDTLWERFGHCVVRGGMWWAELFTDKDVRLHVTF